MPARAFQRDAREGRHGRKKRSVSGERGVPIEEGRVESDIESATMKVERTTKPFCRAKGREKGRGQRRRGKKFANA